MTTKAYKASLQKCEDAFFGITMVAMLLNSIWHEEMSDMMDNVSNPLNNLKKVFLEFFKDEDVKVVLFGSRARGEFVNTSDVDVGIIIGNGVDRRKLTLLRENIDELNVPYKVEIVDFSTVSEGFKIMALKEAVVWKD